jgi:SAM-dependent methyltransferase
VGTQSVAKAEDVADLEEFLNPPFNRWNMESYYIRFAVLRALKAALPRMRGTLLDIGCGRSPYRSVLLGPGDVTRYIGMDLEGGYYNDNGHPNLRWDGKRIPLPDASIDTAIATEVLEHCPYPEVVLSEIHRVLKSSSLLFLTVPFLWPLHDNPHDEYRYTPFSMERHLRSCGYTDIRISATGGWNASLATMIGLWLRRRQLGFNTRRIMQTLVFPFYKWLLQSDVIPSDFSQEGMITGLSVTAVKP